MDSKGIEMAMDRLEKCTKEVLDYYPKVVMYVKRKLRGCREVYYTNFGNCQIDKNCAKQRRVESCWGGFHLAMT